MAKIDLKDKPICITGASAGIGRATAIECARAGMPVVLAARREDKLREVAAEIEGMGGTACVVAADVKDAASCERMIEAGVERFGSLYAVFANAGYGLERAVHEMSDEEMREIFEINFFGTMNTIRPAVAHMLSRKSGHVMICSSCVARFALPYYGAYSATKAAQHHIGRAMRLELEPFGVHVSTVHPVGTKTEFFDEAKKRSGGTPLVEHTSERFMQTPERVARAVVRRMQRPGPEVWTSRLVQWGMAAAAPIPKVADAAVRGMVRKRLARQGGEGEFASQNTEKAESA